MGELEPVKLRQLVYYFLHLGTLEFGGPIARAAYMQRDLVAQRIARCLLLAVIAACGNNLPPPGMCDVATNGETATVTPVVLGGIRASYDDLRYSPELKKVVAAPTGTGQIYLIDPDSLAVQMVPAPRGVYSADAAAATVYAADRGSDQIVAIDIASATTVATQPMPGTPC